MNFKTKNNNFTIRFAQESDIPIILNFIRELAEYENLLEEVLTTEEDLRTSLFKDKSAQVILGEYNHIPVGFALYFHNYSTWRGKSGLYLEDLYIQPAFRSRGLGNIMFTFLAIQAKKKNCARFEWSCLNWNETSIQFYKNLGAEAMVDWTIYRLSGEHLDTLANQPL